jgi:hypothetical protein
MLVTCKICNEATATSISEELDAVMREIKINILFGIATNTFVILSIRLDQDLGSNT